MHLALFQSPDTVPLALPAVDDRTEPVSRNLPNKTRDHRANLSKCDAFKKTFEGTARYFFFFLKNYSISIFLKLECQKMFKTKM